MTLYISFGDADYTLYQYEVLTNQEALIPATTYGELDEFVKRLPYDPRPPLSRVVGVTNGLDRMHAIDIGDLRAYVEWVVVEPMAVVLLQVIWLPLMN